MRTQHALHTLQAFPVYSLGFIKDNKLLLGGGGGATPQACSQRLYEVDEAGAKIDLVTELELEKDEDAPMSMAIDHGQNAFVCGINGSMEKVEAGVNPHCRAFSIEMKEDTKPLIKFERSTQLVKEIHPEAFQKVTALSKDGTILAAGSSDGKPFNQITTVSYPKLDLVSEPFTIPSGELFDADFSIDGHLIVTSTTNLYVFAPSSTPAKASPSTTHPQLKLINTIPVPASHPNSSFRATRWSPENSKTAWSVINTTSGAVKDRRAWIARWDITGLGGDKDGGKGDWKIGRMGKVATRPVTVFDVSQDGKLLAFGSSDLSVGILDSQKLVPLLTILRAHEFPPTALRFNPGGTMLASASADNTLRLIAVPSSFGQSAMTTILILFVLLVGLLAVLIQRGDITW
ncbi:Membrane glycoprotein spo14 [Ceratobasidium theobromae]|uniref:Membrane glycoprotein spo14 n=1 Tax=Ceratobasidium theobromae TaxID=1582974 RepID=A0A5N5QXB7_9AGAM|nr:Membrane glycoprotein spo14 [Ceratobasidium theobromae]